MIDAKTLAWDEPVQDCFDTVNNKSYVFASRLMYEYCVTSNHPKQLVVMDDEAYGVIINQNLSRRKMRNLNREWGDKLHENNAKRPLLFARIRPDLSFLADGNHRYAYLWERGATFCIAYVCDRPIWEKFLIFK